MENTNRSTTADMTFLDLCEQVDYWKEESEMWRQKYKEEVAENNRHMNERMAEAKKGIGQALMFALSVREGEDGSLVIPSDERKSLAETFSN